MVEEIGINVVFSRGYCFHKDFINSYRGLTTVQARRKLKRSYTRSMQDDIIRYLKSKGIIKTEL